MARFNASGMFQPFSLADSIKDTQVIQLNKLKLQSLQGEIQRKRDLRQMASESTRPVMEDQPTYGQYEDPAQQMEGAPLPEGLQEQTGTEQVQTGTEFDDEAYINKLKQGGEIGLAQKMEAHLGQMDKEEREDSIYKLKGMSRLMAGVETEEQYNSAEEEGVKQGFMTREQADAMAFSPENVKKAQQMGQAIKDLYADDDGVSSGTSEFERHIQRQIKTGRITKDQGMDLIAKRAATMAGTEQSEHQKVSLTDKQVARRVKQTEKMRDDALKGASHFQSQRIAINDAIAAMESGDTGLADTLMAQVLSQVQDTNVRAFQMYAEFDRSYGNLAERTFNSLSKFFGGKRTPTEREEIKQTLLNFKKHSDPAARNVRNRYRSLAKNSGLDPWSVVPPDSAEDVRDAPGFGRAEKLEVLKRNPHLFQKGGR